MPFAMAAPKAKKRPALKTASKVKPSKAGAKAGAFGAGAKRPPTGHSIAGSAIPVQLQGGPRPGRGSHLALVQASDPADFAGSQALVPAAGKAVRGLFDEAAPAGDDLSLLLPEEDTYDTKLFVQCANGALRAPAG